MGKINSKIALDSQSYSYLLQAIHGIEKPTNEHAKENLAKEKIALIRTFFYLDDCLYLPPTVVQEYEKIVDQIKLHQHKSFHDTLFCDLPTHPDKDEFEKCVENFLTYHSKRKDCQILAECHLCGWEFLISRDTDFNKHLNGQSSVQILFPSQYWEKLSIQKGATPKTIPHSTNPLSNEDWWRW